MAFELPLDNGRVALSWFFLEVLSRCSSVGVGVGVGEPYDWIVSRGDWTMDIREWTVAQADKMHVGSA